MRPHGTCRGARLWRLMPKTSAWPRPGFESLNIGQGWLLASVPSLPLLCRHSAPFDSVVFAFLHDIGFQHTILVFTRTANSTDRRIRLSASPSNCSSCTPCSKTTFHQPLPTHPVHGANVTTSYKVNRYLPLSPLPPSTRSPDPPASQPLSSTRT